MTLVKLSRDGIHALGRTREEAQANLDNYSRICSYGHDHSMAFCLSYDDPDEVSRLLKLGAESREFANQYTTDWLTKTNQLDRRTSV